MSDTAKITSSEYKSFTCIVDFIEQLKAAICSEDNQLYHEVALYNHLIHKVKITNKQNIRRHISLFSEFCARNTDAIIKKDSSLIVFTTVKYSEKVFINLGSILNSVSIDKEIKDAIWNHLLVIQASIDPSSKARNVLMGLAESKVPEEQMIGGLIGEISKHVDAADERNPMAIFNSLMQSGVVNKMMSSLDNSVKSGEVDMNRLGNTIQGMMSGLMGAMGGMGAAPGAPSGSASAAPGGLDFGNMMSTMMGMMSGMNMAGSSSSSGLSGTNPELIRQQLEKQIEEEMKKEKQQEDVSLNSQTSSSSQSSSSSSPAPTPSDKEATK